KRPSHVSSRDPEVGFSGAANYDRAIVCACSRHQPHENIVTEVTKPRKGVDWVLEKRPGNHSSDDSKQLAVIVVDCEIALNQAQFGATERKFVRGSRVRGHPTH